MRNIIRSMYQQFTAKEDMVLVTVIAASGATPRGAGARMLVTQAGRLCGTIGGGAVEYRAIQVAQDVLQTKTSASRSFSLTRGDVENLGMICGGAVEVFFHYLPADCADTHNFVTDAMQRLFRKADLWLLSDLSQGGTLSLLDKTSCPEFLLPHLNRHPKRISEGEKKLFIEQILFSDRVYIFGGGHVAQELEPVLSHVGFSCIVMDDRPEFTNPDLFPTAEQVLTIDFTRITDYVQVQANDYVCIMTRGHAYDTLVQAQILKMNPCYIGVIGSASKAAGVRKALIDEYGFSDADVDRITTPIGLKIGAQTPEEIAVSIAAQMIAVRASRE